jgi:hypothetical protein
MKTQKERSVLKTQKQVDLDLTGVQFSLNMEFYFITKEKRVYFCVVFYERFLSVSIIIAPTMAIAAIMATVAGIM